MSTPRPRLYLNQDAAADWLIALEFGRVDEGQPSDSWGMITPSLGILHDEDRPVGFKLVGLADYDPDDPDHAELWDAPRFDVPALGLTDVAPNAIIVATRALFGLTRTVNRELFSAAIAGDGEVALRRWVRCLQAGDSMAHFALGYTLYELGRHPEAYRHLRHYAEIAPREGWAWVWLGKAAAAIGEDDEAIAAWARVEEVDDDECVLEEARELAEAHAAGTLEHPSTADADEAFRDAMSDLFDLTSLESVWGETEHGATGLFATAPPVWLDVHRTSGALRVRALVGYVPTGDLVQDDYDDLLEELGELQDVALDGDELWTVLVLPWAVGPHDVHSDVLQAVLLGAADCARTLAFAAEELGFELGEPADHESQWRAATT